MPNIFDSVVASEFEILAYDQRGLGQTTVPDGPYTMQDYAEDADALFLLRHSCAHVMAEALQNARRFSFRAETSRDELLSSGQQIEVARGHSDRIRDNCAVRISENVEV